MLILFKSKMSKKKHILCLAVLLGLQAMSTVGLDIKHQEETITDGHQTSYSKMATPEPYKGTTPSPMISTTSLSMTGIYQLIYFPMKVTWLYFGFNLSGSFWSVHFFLRTSLIKPDDINKDFPVYIKCHSSINSKMFWFTIIVMYTHILYIYNI